MSVKGELKKVLIVGIIMWMLCKLIFWNLVLVIPIFSLLFLLYLLYKTVFVWK